MDGSKQGNPHSSSLPGVLGLVDNAISRVESVMLAAGVILMALNTVANVVGRFIFQYSLFFSEELNRILIILITFAGISYAARMGRHIRMSAIYDALSPALRKVFMVVIAVVTALSMFALCYFSIGYITKVAISGRVLPSLQIPVYWIFLWVPVGFFMTGLQYALTAIKNLIEPRTSISRPVCSRDTRKTNSRSERRRHGTDHLPDHGGSAAARLPDDDSAARRDLCRLHVDVRRYRPDGLHGPADHGRHPPRLADRRADVHPGRRHHDPRPVGRPADRHGHEVRRPRQVAASPSARRPPAPCSAPSPAPPRRRSSRSARRCGRAC